MSSCVDSLGYMVLKRFELDKGKITKDDFIFFIDEEIYSFLQEIKLLQEEGKDIRNIREAIQGEFLEKIDSYGKGEFFGWLDKEYGEALEHLTEFYSGIIE